MLKISAISASHSSSSLFFNIASTHHTFSIVPSGFHPASIYASIVPSSANGLLKIVWVIAAVCLFNRDEIPAADWVGVIVIPGNLSSSCSEVKLS